MAKETAFDDARGRGRSKGRVIRLALTVTLVTLVLVGPLGATAPAVEAGSKAQHVWLDADGQPLPFQGNAGIEEFLRTADVVSREEIGIGINKMDKLLLEKDGVQVHAIFRDVDVEERGVQVGDRFYRRFKDSYAGECAAYAVAQLLEMDNVPPVVSRVLNGRHGSMQIWIEKVRDKDSDSFRPPNALQWVAQTWDMVFFDNLILNVDRNSGNILVGQHYRLWLIDHTRAFEPRAELLAPDKVQRVNREVWTRLLDLSDEELADATRDFLDPGQVGAFKERRKLLVEHVQGLIQELGRGVVLH